MEILLGLEEQFIKYSGLIKNDVAAGNGFCVSFFSQGCPHRCPGCHNPETWDFNGGLEFTTDTLKDIIEAISANGLQRDLCIMGGEPLCQENAFLTCLIITKVKEKYPNIKIYIWTGYTYGELLQYPPHEKIPAILEAADYLIDGPFVQEKRDITLKMRGSSNQRIWDLKNNIEITNNF